MKEALLSSGDSEKPDCCIAQKQSGSEEVKRVFRAEMLRSVGGFCSWLSRLHSPVQAQSINKSPESRTHWAVIGAGKPPRPIQAKRATSDCLRQVDGTWRCHRGRCDTGLLA